MHVIYIITTCLAAFVNGYAAFSSISGAESVKVVADRVRVPRAWMVPLGTLLACGAVGLLSGFAVPALGTAAAIGYLEEAEQLADRIAILHQGRIITNGTLAELKQLLPPAEVEYVEKQPSLEDVFFAVVGDAGKDDSPRSNKK